VKTLDFVGEASRGAILASICVRSGLFSQVLQWSRLSHLLITRCVRILSTETSVSPDT